jgi:hypothetical protein
MEWVINANISRYEELQINKPLKAGIFANLDSLVS